MPSGALEILEGVIAENPKHQRNQLLHRLRGEALGALGREEDAVAAFRESLEFRKRDPRSDADASLSLAWFVVVQELHHHFSEAAAALRDHPPTITTPLADYRFHGCAAILEAHAGRDAEATRHAQSARLAARRITQDGPAIPALACGYTSREGQPTARGVGP